MQQIKLIGKKMNMNRSGLYALFGCIGFASFLVATNGWEILLAVLLANSSVEPAIQQSLHYMFEELFGTVMLATPFLVISVLAAEMAKAFSLKKGGIFFAVFASCLALLYFLGYLDSQQAMLARSWTAASLSVGFLPFKSIPLLLIGGIVVALAFSRKAKLSHKGQSESNT